MLKSFGVSSRNFSKSSIIKSLIEKTINERPDGLLPEHEVLSILGEIGFSIAPHKYADKKTCAPEVFADLNRQTHEKFNLVAKGVVRTKKDNVLVTHKTDIGALQFNVPKTIDGIHQAMQNFKKKFDDGSPYNLEGILFVEQMKLPNDFGTEMLVSGYQDPFFGPTVCYGFGGTIVEYLKKVRQ